MPTIKAAMDLNANNPAQATVFLEAAAPYELGQPGQIQLGTMYPAYIRGQAQLMAHNGPAGAAEFQKFLDHRGLVTNFPLGALAHLGLAPAYALSGDTVKAKTAYQGFLTLWKDADPDIPILKEAKAEYAKLQYREESLPCRLLFLRWFTQPGVYTHNPRLTPCPLVRTQNTFD